MLRILGRLSREGAKHRVIVPKADMGAPDNVSMVAGSHTKATQRLERNTTRGRVCEDVMYEKTHRCKERSSTGPRVHASACRDQY